MSAADLPARFVVRPLLLGIHAFAVMCVALVTACGLVTAVGDNFNATVRISLAGTGTGNVKSDTVSTPAPFHTLNCGLGATVCEVTGDLDRFGSFGEEVGLTASPGAGSTFVSWGGDCVHDPLVTAPPTAGKLSMAEERTYECVATFNLAPPDTAIAKSQGDNQSATVNSAVAVSPTVQVTFANGNPLENVPVTFAVTPGGGTVTGANQVTDANGLAAVGSWTLGAVGPNELTATVTGLAPVVFTATGIAAPPAGCTVLSDNFDKGAQGVVWDTTSTSTQNPVSHTVFAALTGGNPAGFRQMAHVFNDPATITVFHLYPIGYDPAQQGPIRSLSFFEDQIELNPPFLGAAVGSGVFLEQGGNRYLRAHNPQEFNNTVWQTAQILNLAAADFPGVNLSSAIRFGFYRSNTNTGGSGTGSGKTFTHGIDNWRVEICR